MLRVELIYTSFPVEKNTTKTSFCESNMHASKKIRLFNTLQNPEKRLSVQFRDFFYRAQHTTEKLTCIELFFKCNQREHSSNLEHLKREPAAATVRRNRNLRHCRQSHYDYGGS